MFLHAFLPLYKLCLVPGTHICLASSKSYLYVKIQSNVHSFIHSISADHLLGVSGSVLGVRRWLRHGAALLWSPFKMKLPLGFEE